MTAKEKSEELYGLIYSSLPEDSSIENAHNSTKTLIALFSDQIISSITNKQDKELMVIPFSFIEFWQQVKQESIKL